MASASIPAPGTKLGPCKTPCQHIDCASSRAEACNECWLCHKAIGYETAYLRVDDGPVHTACAERKWGSLQ